MTIMPNVNPASFFSEVKSELLKVTWPKKDQVVKLTGVVILISLGVGFFIGGLDLIFTKTVEFLIKK
jgi:preprotein translocase subunit SecE